MHELFWRDERNITKTFNQDTLPQGKRSNLRIEKNIWVAHRPGAIVDT